MHDLHYNIYTWDQYEKAIAAWLHHIRNKMIYAPGGHPFLTIHHLTVEIKGKLYTRTAVLV